jgi:tRNA pseudouridine55 synthase
MNGLVVVDKPAGMTSHDVVTRVKKMLGGRKAGHTGTLDPLATGVLPVCLDEATKLSPFLSAHTKEYRATLLLGVETDTLDVEGKITEQRPPETDVDRIEKAFERLVGAVEQRPPRFSAVKHKGRPLYHWARRGVTVEAPVRQVFIYRLELEEVALPYVTFSVSCSAGTYIRSICADVGNALGCGACLAQLRRLRSGAFHEAAAVPLDDREALEGAVVTMAEAVSHLPSFSVDAAGAQRLRDGVQPEGNLFQGHDISFLVAGDVITFVTSDGRLAAIAVVDGVSEGEGISGERDLSVRVLRVFFDSP